MPWLYNHHHFFAFTQGTQLGKVASKRMHRHLLWAADAGTVELPDSFRFQGMNPRSLLALGYYMFNVSRHRRGHYHRGLSALECSRCWLRYIL